MILLNHNIKDPQGFNVSTSDLLSILKGLRLGQIIRGKVLDVLDSGEILALINGQKFRAQSDLNLVEGDVLFLKVLSMKPNVVFQLYGIDTEKNIDPIVNILRMFNLDEGGLNKKVISSMINNNVSIDKSDILKFSETLNHIFTRMAEYEGSKEIEPELNGLLDLIKNLKVPISEEKLIDAMIFLQSKNIPVTIKTTLIAYVFLNKDTEISSDITNFFNILNNIKDDYAYRENPFLSLNIGDENIPIEKILQKIGLDYEKKISELIGPENNKLKIDAILKQIAHEVINNIESFEGLENSEKLKLLSLKIINNTEISSDITNFFSILNKIKNDYSFNENLSLSVTPSNENIHVEKILQKIGLDYEKILIEYTGQERKKVNSDVTLKQIALEVINNIKLFEGLDNSEKLKLLSLKILNNIEFQQIMNSDDSADIKNWYFQFPLKIENEDTTVDLKIAGKNKKSGKIKKVPYNFNLSVDFSAIGNVRSHGSLYQNSLSISFYLQDDKNINIFKEDLEYLNSKFKDLGLMLQNTTIEKYNPNSVAEFNTKYNASPVSINMRA